MQISEITGEKKAEISIPTLLYHDDRTRRMMIFVHEFVPGERIVYRGCDCRQYLTRLFIGYGLIMAATLGFLVPLLACRTRFLRERPSSPI
jgi:hypothetical protein